MVKWVTRWISNQSLTLVLFDPKRQKLKQFGIDFPNPDPNQRWVTRPNLSKKKLTRPNPDQKLLTRSHQWSFAMSPSLCYKVAFLIYNENGGMGTTLEVQNVLFLMTFKATRGQLFSFLMVKILSSSMRYCPHLISVNIRQCCNCKIISNQNC